MFLRNVLVKVLIWHLSEHELPSSEGIWSGPRRSLGHHGASGGALGALGRPLEVSGGVPEASLGALGVPEGSLRERAGRPLRVP